MVKETIIISSVAAQLGALRAAVEHEAGREMRLPSDFEFLAKAVDRKTNERISTNTLKRLWGYLEGYTTSRRFTLNVLSRYVGHNSWDDFCLNLNATASSQIFDSQAIDCEALEVGATVVIKWHPERVAKIKYNGNNSFTVVESQNGKLMVGDTFTCQAIIPGQPLVVNNLVHQGFDHPVNYICGKQGGVECVILS